MGNQKAFLTPQDAKSIVGEAETHFRDRKEAVTTMTNNLKTLLSRKLKAALGTDDPLPPPIWRWVCQEAERFARHLEDVRKGRGSPHQVLEPTFQTVPCQLATKHAERQGRSSRERLRHWPERQAA